MKFLALSKKEALDILSNRLYILLVLVQVIILLGAYGLAAASSVAADPQLIDTWGGGRFLRIGLDVDEKGSLLDESLRREGLNVSYYSVEDGRRALGSKILAFVYLKGGDIAVEADTSSVFYTVMSEKLRRATSDYARRKQFREAGLPASMISALENPVNLKVVPRNREGYRPLVLESSYFVEIMYGFIVPFILFLPFFLGSNMVTDSIVGEKERKTFEVLLMTPLPDTLIILGKIIPPLMFSFLQGMLWIIILSALKVPIYNIPLILVLLLFTGLAFTGVGMFISTLADSTKEANSAITVALFFATFILFVPLFMDMGPLTDLVPMIPSYVLVRLSSCPHCGPEALISMVPSGVASILIFAASIVSFRREGVIRL